MAHERSPNYPGSNLRVAIEDAKAIYARERRTDFPMEIAAKALGYSSLNGSARVRLASLRQYGLMEQKKGEMNARLTPEALTLVLRTEETREYRQALQKASLEPHLFAELSETHLDASDDSLRHHLIIKKGFTHEGASRCAEIFRATMQLANLGESDNISGHEEGKIHSDMEWEMASPTQAKYERTRQIASDDAQTVTYHWPLSKTATAAVTLTGTDIQPQDIRLLRAYLILVEHALQDRNDRSQDIEHGKALAIELPTLFVEESSASERR